MWATGLLTHAGRSTWTLHTLSLECPSPPHHASEPHPPSPAQGNPGGKKGWEKITWVNERRSHSTITETKGKNPEKLKMLILTFETRKQKADNLVLALSGSTTNRPFSSSRHRYRPVVMWRIRNDWPHFMWLPLQLQAEIRRKTTDFQKAD